MLPPLGPLGMVACAVLGCRRRAVHLVDHCRTADGGFAARRGMALRRQSDQCTAAVRYGLSRFPARGAGSCQTQSRGLSLTSLPEVSRRIHAAGLPRYLVAGGISGSVRRAGALVGAGVRLFRCTGVMGPPGIVLAVVLVPELRCGCDTGCESPPSADWWRSSADCPSSWIC